MLSFKFPLVLATRTGKSVHLVFGVIWLSPEEKPLTTLVTSSLVPKTSGG